MANTDSKMGHSGRQLVTLFQAEDVDPDTQPKLARKLPENRTKLTSETGFMMVFGEQDHRKVSTYAAYDLGGDSYPVSQSAFDSLPPYVRGTLERDEEIQILAQYDPGTGEFTDVSLANEPTPGEIVDWIGANIGNGLSLHEAIDYLAVEKLDRYSEEQWASIREVNSEAIRSSVRNAKEDGLSHD
jgi:hypothetical protein